MGGGDFKGFKQSKQDTVLPPVLQAKPRIEANRDIEIFCAKSRLLISSYVVLWIDNQHRLKHIVFLPKDSGIFAKIYMKIVAYCSKLKD